MLPYNYRSLATLHIKLAIYMQKKFNDFVSPKIWYLLIHSLINIYFDMKSIKFLTFYILCFYLCVIQVSADHPLHAVHSFGGSDPTDTIFDQISHTLQAFGLICNLAQSFNSFFTRKVQH